MKTAATLSIAENTSNNASDEAARNEEILREVMAAHNRSYCVRMWYHDCSDPTIVQRLARLERSLAAHGRKINELSEEIAEMNEGIDKLVEGLKALREATRDQSDVMKDSKKAAEDAWTEWKKEANNLPTEAEDRKARIDATREQIKALDEIGNGSERTE